jgi:hypothetical protein
MNCRDFIEPLTRAELSDLAEDRDHRAQIAAEAEVDRDMPWLDGEARYREVMRRLQNNMAD